MGTLIHEDTYKIRLAIKSKGKSGGLRAITYVVELETVVAEAADGAAITVFLVSIYDKSEQVNISEKDLRQFIDEINAELDGEE